MPLAAKEVQPLITEHLAGAQQAMLEALKKGEQIPALSKLKLREKAFTDPWAALRELEEDIHSAVSKPSLGSLIWRLGGFLSRGFSGGQEKINRSLNTWDDFVDTVLLKRFDEARHARDKALKAQTPKQRQVLFDHAPRLVARFGPQLAVNKGTEPLLEADRHFCENLADANRSEMLSAASTLAEFCDPEIVHFLKVKYLDKLKPIAEKIAGLSGDILYKKETPHGLILVGGTGPNTYDLKVPVALLIDLGGDDVYQGVVASSFDDEHPNCVVIDIAGNDIYEPSELGLATGRLGVGILLDVEGNDTYKLAPGCGGVGLGGIGVLVDAKGNDKYHGTRFTQGAAVMGVGLLWDMEGNDIYTSRGLAVGFGGPGGVGCLLDSAGNDSYQCGKHYPSGYNQSDAPNAKPGDANFQWDSFGLGMGLGRRVWPPQPEHMKYNLAGGIGMVIDVAGNDRYEASNFSLACGYFFGIGVILDFEGNDQYHAARYGLSSGAHYGMGLFCDYGGKDTYLSIGPTYNCAASWDRSVFLFIDAGPEDDVYSLERSAGMARADHGSWAVFCDLGGSDRYVVPSGLGEAAPDSNLAVFFDRAGNDDYNLAYPSAKDRPGNGKLFNKGAGGLFVDR